MSNKSPHVPVASHPWRYGMAIPSSTVDRAKAKCAFCGRRRTLNQAGRCQECQNKGRANV